MNPGDEITVETRSGLMVVKLRAKPMQNCQSPCDGCVAQFDKGHLCGLIPDCEDVIYELAEPEVDYKAIAKELRSALDSIYRQADDVAQRWEGGCPIQIGELVTSVAAANALLEKTQFLE